MAGKLKTDLLLTQRGVGMQASNRLAIDLALQPRDLALQRHDLGVTHGRNNLAQAMVNRLYTRQGELANLGHPEYGSRLYQLLGQPNNSRTRVLAERYIRESLAAEPRIAEIVDIVLGPPSRQLTTRTVLDVQVTVRPLDDDETPDETRLAITVSLELGG